MKRKFLSTIGGASLYISLVLVLTKGVGFIREIVFAGYYGTGQQYDIYLVSSVIPITLNIIVFYVGQNFFIPALNNHAISNDKTPAQLTKQVFISYILFVFILIIPIFIFSDWILQSFFSSQKILVDNTANLIFRLLLLTVPLSAGISILTAYLNSNLEFRYPAISYLFINSSIIILVISLSKFLDNVSIALGYLFGTILQCIYLLKKTFGFRAFIVNYRELFPNQIRSLISINILYIVFIESIGQLYMIIDRIFFESLPIGGVASINYAQSLFQFPISIFTFALSTAIFPRISKIFAQHNFTEVSRILSESIRITILIFIPISVIFIFYGIPIIRLIYERGNFSDEGTILTSEALGHFSISLVFYATYSVLNKVFYSADLSKYLLLITIAGICLKYILNHILIIEFAQAGLALSTSITYMSFLIISIIIFKFKLNLDLAKIFCLELTFNIFNAILSYLLVEELFDLFNMNEIILLKIIIFLMLYLINNILLNHSTIEFLKSVLSINQLSFSSN